MDINKPHAVNRLHRMHNLHATFEQSNLDSLLSTANSCSPKILGSVFVIHYIPNSPTPFV